MASIGEAEMVAGMAGRVQGDESRHVVPFIEGIVVGEMSGLGPMVYISGGPGRRFQRLHSTRMVAMRMRQHDPPNRHTGRRLDDIAHMNRIIGARIEHRQPISRLDQIGVGSEIGHHARVAGDDPADAGEAGKGDAPRGFGFGQEWHASSYHISGGIRTPEPALALSAAFPQMRAMAIPDPEAPLRRSLARHRAFASGLLILMAVLTVIGYALPLSWPAVLLRDSAKAGLIGGIADWFAVTALFRHPLGLPIPHTAILPAQKQRLGGALGRFVANHVFTEADVTRFLAGLDIPQLAGRFLADPATSRPMAEGIASLLPRLLVSVEDGRAMRAFGRLLPRLVGGPAAGQAIARALSTVVESGRHQEVFSFLINQMRDTLKEREATLGETIKERVREQGGALIGWALGATITRRVLTALNTELERVGPDGSELREAFDEWVRREIVKLENDPDRIAELGEILRRVATHHSMRLWLNDVWMRLQSAVVEDSARPNGHTITIVQRALINLGKLLAEDPATRARVSAAAGAVVTKLLPSAQTEIAGFIGRVVGNWDAATITDKLELRIGRDLQYIRVNGTLVGFAIGALLTLILHYGVHQTLH